MSDNTNYKITLLREYQSALETRLQATTTPEKHKNRDKEFRQYLERELESVKTKIERLVESR